MKPTLDAAFQNAPLLAQPAYAAPSAPVRTRSLWLAFLAAAVAALVGGLLWAGISIATGYNIGILALFIAMLTVSFQAVKAALTNPVKSLRTE